MNTFRFGKYKDQTLESVANEDGRYIIWLRKQNWINDELKSELDRVMDQVVLNFGKNKGKTMAALKASQPKYHKWLLTSEDK